MPGDALSFDQETCSSNFSCLIEDRVHQACANALILDERQDEQSVEEAAEAIRQWMRGLRVPSSDSQDFSIELGHKHGKGSHVVFSVLHDWNS